MHVTLSMEMNLCLDSGHEPEPGNVLKKTMTGDFYPLTFKNIALETEKVVNLYSNNFVEK